MMLLPFSWTPNDFMVWFYASRKGSEHFVPVSRPLLLGTLILKVVLSEADHSADIKICLKDNHISWLFFYKGVTFILLCALHFIKGHLHMFFLSHTSFLAFLRKANILMHIRVQSLGLWIWPHTYLSIFPCSRHGILGNLLCDVVIQSEFCRQTSKVYFLCGKCTNV